MMATIWGHIYPKRGILATTAQNSLCDDLSGRDFGEKVGTGGSAGLWGIFDGGLSKHCDFRRQTPLWEHHFNGLNNWMVLSQSQRHNESIPCKCKTNEKMGPVPRHQAVNRNSPEPMPVRFVKRQLQAVKGCSWAGPAGGNWRGNLVREMKSQRENP